MVHQMHRIDPCSAGIVGTARVDKGLKKELERILSGLILVRCSVAADAVVH